MPISWNEIRQNAIRFSREWAEEHREDAEAKSFWDEFFGVFGVRRRLLATFEEPVRKINGQYGYIDLFWRGMMLAEHKSRANRSTRPSRRRSTTFRISRASNVPTTCRAM